MKRNRKHNVGRKTVGSLAAIACAGSLAPVAAFGQGASEFEALDLHTPYTKTHVIPGFGHRLGSDVDNSGALTGGPDDAELSETSFSVRGGPGFSLSEDLHLYALASYRFSRYDWKNTPGDQFEDIHMFRATPVLRWTMDETWTIYGGPTIAFAAEDGADFGSSVTGGGFGAFSYKVHEDLAVGAGLGIFSQIEDDARIVPFVTADWRFYEQWNLHVGFTEVAATGGLGAEVSYDLNDQWRVGGGIQFQQKRFRLAEATGDAVAQDKSIPIFARATWKMSENMAFEFLAGVAAGGELLIEDNDGNEIFEEDYDPSALIGLRAVFNF